MAEEIPRELARLLVVSSVETGRLLPLLVTGSDDVAVIVEFPSVRLPVAEILLSDMLLMELRGPVSVSGPLELAAEDSGTLPVAAPASPEVKMVSLGYIVSVKITLDDKVTIVIIADVGLAEVSIPWELLSVCLPPGRFLQLESVMCSAFPAMMRVGG